MQPNPVKAPELYEKDFVQWIEAQSAAVREGRWSDVDAAHVAEELDSLGNSNRQQIGSRLRVLMAHLLKSEVQAGKKSRSWELTILEQSARIRGILESSPSLRRELTAAIHRQYRTARKRASIETKLPLTAFPAEPTPEFEARVLENIDADQR